MKKIASCLLALALLVTLTACSGKSDNLSDGTDSPSGTVSDTMKDTEKGTETAPAETTGESDTVGTETNTEQPTSDSKATAPAKDTTSATTPPATNPPATNPPKETTPPATNPPTVAPCSHSNTEVRNKKDATTSAKGYTGDTYCKNCGKLISSGSSIPKIKQTYTATHDYYDIEMEVFRLINEERAKAKVAPLVWDEDIYRCAKIRAQEYPETWSHTRPNGSKSYTVYAEESNYTVDDFATCGENLNSCIESDINSIAKYLVNKWMDSDGHRDNILYSEFAKTAISVIYYGPDRYSIAQLFYGM